MSVEGIFPWMEPTLQFNGDDQSEDMANEILLHVLLIVVSVVTSSTARLLS
jgi:hypothetical protein